MNHIDEIQGPSLKLQEERKAIITEGDSEYFRTETKKIKNEAKKKKLNN